MLLVGSDCLQKYRNNMPKLMTKLNYKHIAFQSHTRIQTHLFCGDVEIVIVT